MTRGRTAEWREGDPLPTCPNCTGGDVSANHSRGWDCWDTNIISFATSRYDGTHAALIDYMDDYTGRFMNENGDTWSDPLDDWKLTDERLW